MPLFLRFGGIDFDADPDARDTLDDLVVRAQRVVDGNGGSLLQLTLGDKGAYLYAVFGSPIAYEDDAARACWSALELLALEGETAATGLTVGIATGRLRSGTYGSAAAPDVLLPRRRGQPGGPADGRGAARLGVGVGRRCGAGSATRSSGPSCRRCRSRARPSPCRWPPWSTGAAARRRSSGGTRGR